MRSVAYPPRHLSWSFLNARSGLDIDVNRHTVRGDDVAHEHEFVEVAVVCAGSGAHEAGGRRESLGAGDVLIVRPGAWHAYRQCDSLQVANCCFHPRLLERELLWLSEEERLRGLLWPFGETAREVARLRLSDAGREGCLTALHRLAAPPNEEPRAYQLAHLLLFLRCLAGHLEEALPDDPGRGTANGAVGEALELMTADLSRPWNLVQLAEALAISPTHLSRLFRRGVGRPPMAHLALLRMEMAAAMLLRGDEPVSTIGAAVGLADPNYFARRFRAHFGVSPTAFRRATRRPEAPSR